MTDSWASPADMSAPAAVTTSAPATRLHGSSLIFGRLADQTPYMHLGGRITPKINAG
jgi:hypothetical protein